MTVWTDICPHTVDIPIYTHTFLRDILSPGVNLLSEMHINQHMLSGCHTQTSPDDTFLRNIIVHDVVSPL